MIYSELFIGPIISKSIREWLHIFKVIDNETLLKKIKSSDEYLKLHTEDDVEDGDSILLNEWVDYIDYLDDLSKKLKSLGLQFAGHHNMPHSHIRIGRKIKNVRDDFKNDY